MAKIHHMNPMATSKHWSDLRTDDDIQSAVSTFLEDESHNLHGKTLHESIVEVSRWLGTQIQQEREGWAYKIRMAMQEIENHRRETLKIHSVIQECTNQLRLIAECCNMDDDLLVKISQEDTKRALPMYIECLAELINTLVEDRLQCLQLLQLSENDIDGQTVYSVLNLYLHRLEFNSGQTQKEQDDHVIHLERENTKLIAELNRLKKQLNKAQEDYEKIRTLLQVLQSEKHGDNSHMYLRDRASPNSLMGVSINAVIKDDLSGIQITEEKLLKLQSSAKRLENSLQDALSQIDRFHRNAKGTSKQTPVNELPMSSKHNFKLKPLMPVTTPEGELSKPKQLSKIAYVLQSSTATTNHNQNNFHDRVHRSFPERAGRFQIRHLSSISDTKSLELNDPPMVRTKWRRRTISPVSLSTEKTIPFKERSLPKMQAPPPSSKSFTFRSLVRSLDEMRAKKTSKTKGGQKVSKCLRCQKLFTLNNNHKKACCYHPRSKERVEEYNTKGRLTRVSYLWQCCREGVDSQGCLYGQHI